jgi:hypothetical protein
MAVPRAEKDPAMSSKYLIIAAGIVLSTPLGACATQGPEAKGAMMRKGSAMECMQMAEKDEKNDRALKGMREEREGGELKKPGCPMMAAKKRGPDAETRDLDQPSAKDPHADH